MAEEFFDGGRLEFFYDESSNLVRESNSVLRERNQQIEYEYDGLNRLVRVDYPETEDTVYKYGGAGDSSVGAAGKILSVEDASGKISYEYGMLGEVKKEIRTLGTHLNSGKHSETAVMEYCSDYLGRMQWIVYPDGEKVTYGYDAGGQVETVTGSHFGNSFEYVRKILYDEYGQRASIEYGNGTSTEYTYDRARRWLKTVRTENQWGKIFQNLSYSFDPVGNVLGYENNCLDDVTGNYKTSQSYTYDSLYQLIRVDGATTYNPHSSMVPDFMSEYSQTFAFDPDGLGNMTEKVSVEKVTPQKTIGDSLNYSFAYNYDTAYAHRLTNVGDRYYKYDANGNIVCEQDGSFDDSGDDASYVKVTREGEGIYSANYGWGLLKEDDRKNKGIVGGSRRSYTWDERNMLVSSVDSVHSTSYVYGYDGQRSHKYTKTSETLYFNKMWTIHTDNLNATFEGQTSKNIYLGETRIVTKLNSGSSPSYQGEYDKQYYYHSDHLGSASLISDYKGDEYQRIEYTPYGETWVEKTQNQGLEYLPYKFTAKELDEETGLYYYGARYLDPKYSRWLSTDPALGDYIPGAGKGNTKDSGNLPGMGGIYNHINGNLYHYAGNNPVKYVDPDGRCVFSVSSVEINYYSNIELSNVLRNCLGADYSHKRMPTDSKMDCSGMLVYALDKMGYEVPSDLRACKMGSGNLDWIVLYDDVKSERQGLEGTLNFYAFDGEEIDHVNYGVGMRGNETENQIMDASYGSSWQNGRNKNSRQDTKAEENKVNKTYAPFSTRTAPVKQGYVDFTKLKRKVEDE